MVGFKTLNTKNTKYYDTEYKNSIENILRRVKNPNIKEQVKKAFRQILTNPSLTKEDRNEKILSGLHKVTKYLNQEQKKEKEKSDNLIQRAKQLVFAFKKQNETCYNVSPNELFVKSKTSLPLFKFNNLHRKSSSLSPLQQKQLQKHPEKTILASKEKPSYHPARGKTHHRHRVAAC